MHAIQLAKSAESSFLRVLMMVYNTQDYWVFGLWPSSDILDNTKKHNVLETDPISEMLCSFVS
jgi:hypothetical protein